MIKDTTKKNEKNINKQTLDVLHKMLAMITLLRPAQWSKNIFVFFPLFFDKRFTDITALTNTCIAFISFSFAASAVYCLNDIIDKEADSKQPEKKNRPIASGKISTITAILVALISCTIGLTSIYFIDNSTDVLIAVILYLALNILYSFYFKNIPLIDVFFIALGFVIRIVTGGLSGDVHLSHWIVLMTFLLALLLGFAKRLDDVNLHDKLGKVMRKNIVTYNKSFLNAILIITSTMTIICYIMYTVSDEVIKRFDSDYIYITSLFVALGIFRYLQISIVENKSSNPTKILFKDRFLQLAIVCWLISFIIILY